MLAPKRISLIAFLGIFAAACNGSPDSTGAITAGNIPTDNSPTDSGSPTSPPAPQQRQYATDVLIFNGIGTASDDTASIQQIVGSRGLTQKTVSSAQLNAMTAEDLRQYGVIVWPGGLAKTQNDSLTAEARQNVYEAVAEGGVGYVGFCAGAFIAGSYGSWGLELAPFDFPYYYLENQGYTKAMVNVTFADGSARDLIWYGGPELATFGQVLAKYPDGTTAIAQDRVGKGLMILSGPHPEAPSSWKSGLSDSDGTAPDQDYAYQLIQAAMKQQPLPSF